MSSELNELRLTELATSIPGLSAVGAAAILAETGDPNCFASARALVPTLVRLVEGAVHTSKRTETGGLYMGAAERPSRDGRFLHLKESDRHVVVPDIHGKHDAPRSASSLTACVANASPADRTPNRPERPDHRAPTSRTKSQRNPCDQVPAPHRV
jgi:hypothetical protein